MEDVLALLRVLLSNLKQIEDVYNQLLTVLDEEEAFIKGFSMDQLQKTVVEKDLVVAKAQRLEEKRGVCMSRLAPLMGLHTRGKTLSGPEFLCALDVYCKNLKEHTRVDRATMSQLTALKEELGDQLALLQHAFQHHYGPRLERNKILMAKLSRSVGLSLSWMESMARQPVDPSGGGAYGPKGRRVQGRDVSFLTVKV